MVTLYDRTTINTLAWPTDADGDYARRVLGALVRAGPRAFIDNVDAEVRIALVGGRALPVVIPSPQPAIKNAYVCSPTTHYLDYAQREVELELADQPALRHILPPLLEALRPLLHWGRFEQVVFANNWLLSTNLYPPLDRAVLRGLRDRLVAAYPHHTLVFRSVNEALNGELGARLAELGCYPVFSRQVYILDPRDSAYRRKKSFQKDLALARRTAYRWGDAASVRPEESGRVAELYRQLYIEKYSDYNPQFNERFVREGLAEGWLNFFVLRHAGRIDATLGFVERGGVMTAPFIGYDRAIPVEEGFYRLISLKLAEEAQERGLILNQSSGAAAFKRHRGSTPALEHSYIYDAHLPPRQRLPWRLLRALSTRVVVPLMQRYGL